MKTKQEQLIQEVAHRLNIEVIEVKTPPQGMESEVFFVKEKNGNEYAIKFGEGAIGDKIALELIRKNKVNIAVPKVLKSFDFHEKPVLILEKINYPLLESVTVGKMNEYIPSMIKNLKEIHTIKSRKAGYIIEPSEKSSWKEILLSNFTGPKPNIDWQEVSKRKLVDTKIILDSVAKIIPLIEKTKFINNNYSLLHTDFNQRNLFIDPDSDQIASIIDWGEAMFGDPIHDFARIRMFIWHFNLGERVVKDYYKLVSFTEEERNLERIYWLYRVIEYIAWYSEELTKFNVGRIKLHQDFLRTFKWENKT